MTKENDVDKLLKALEEERQARQEAEDKLSTKEEEEKKVEDPMSGPGELCEATKVTLSESWQLKSQEAFNPKTKTEEMVTEPPPEGFEDRLGPNNCHYVVKPEHNDSRVPLKEAVYPNCRSKYTQEYSVYGPKPVQDRGNWEKEPPRYNVHLCEKHANLFGAKKPKGRKKKEK